MTSRWSCRHGKQGEYRIARIYRILGARTLTLANLDEHTKLVVDVGGEDLGLLDGDSHVSFDEGSRDTIGGLNTEGETLSENESRVCSGMSLGGMAAYAAAP